MENHMLQASHSFFFKMCMFLTLRAHVQRVVLWKAWSSYQWCPSFPAQTVKKSSNYVWTSTLGGVVQFHVDIEAPKFLATFTFFLAWSYLLFYNVWCFTMAMTSSTHTRAQVHTHTQTHTHTHTHAQDSTTILALRPIQVLTTDSFGHNELVVCVCASNMQEYTGSSRSTLVHWCTYDWRNSRSINE